MLAARPGFQNDSLAQGQPITFGAPAPASLTSKPLRNTQSKLTGPQPVPGTDLFHRQSSPGRNRLVVIGDAGSGQPIQRRIADQMMKFHQRAPFDTVLMLGDNVYPDGNPRDFPLKIQAVYEPFFRMGVRFKPVLGNHDVKGGFGDQQLALWKVPPYYQFSLGPPENRVDFFALDTTAMLTGTLGAYKKNPEAGRRRAALQMQWLDQALAKSTARMKVVYGHYPVYSSGHHGFLETIRHDFREQLEPVLKKHGVDLYLSGHEHHYERTRPMGGVTYMVSGAAGKSPRRTFPLTLHPREKVLSKNHFIAFEATRQGLTFQVYGLNGELLDYGAIPAK